MAHGTSALNVEGVGIIGKECSAKKCRNSIIIEESLQKTTCEVCNETFEYAPRVVPHIFTNAHIDKVYLLFINTKLN